jgi:hypothetical protein
MKFYFIIVAAIASLTSCQNHDVKKNDLTALAKDTTNYTSIQWIDSLKDIGAVEAGKKTEIKFRFKNTGNKPLFIISAVPGCGCTVADYPKEAIAPGGEGLITAGYNVNAGTEGEFRKNIHITTNTKGATEHYIYFYGAIKDPADSTSRRKIDTAALKARMSNQLKRNLLLKPTKN